VVSHHFNRLAICTLRDGTIETCHVHNFADFQRRVVEDFIIDTTETITYNLPRIENDLLRAKAMLSVIDTIIFGLVNSQEQYAWTQTQYSRDFSKEDLQRLINTARFGNPDGEE
jgi:hypothetical protein